MPNKGYKQTKEHKNKINVEHLKYWSGKERYLKTKQKISVTMMGHVMSEETKQKISKTCQNKRVDLNVRS